MAKRIELLAPSGSLEKAKIALMYGADAVYVGGKKFSLRARASNNSLDDIKELVEFAHALDRKVYVTMNIIPHQSDLDSLDEYLKSIEGFGVDGIIVSSFYIIERAKKIAPNLEIHLSTQRSTTNIQAINYYKNLGVSRVVLGREVTLKEMIEIRRNTSLELEVFIHGGMCSSYSGSCVLSNHMTNRDANRGGCAHSCRWNYSLIKDGEELSGIFNIGSKDLVAVDYISELINIGIDSLKIEGRMKSSYYLACVIKSYRMLIDCYLENGFIDQFTINLVKKEINKAMNRETSCGFFNGIPNVFGQLYDNRCEIPTQEYAMFVLDYDSINKKALVEQRNYCQIGDRLEIFGPKTNNVEFTLTNMIDYETNEVISVARHPLQKIWIDIDCIVKYGDFIRKVRDI